jgi:hypothetical protein
LGNNPGNACIVAYLSRAAGWIKRIELCAKTGEIAVEDNPSIRVQYMDAVRGKKKRGKDPGIQDPPSPPPYLSLDCSLVYIITAVQYKVGVFFFVFDGMG